jgi:hypothetical protein
MRKLVFILIAFIAVVTFIKAIEQSDGRTNVPETLTQLEQY